MVAFGYVIEPVGAAVSVDTVSESAAAFGLRVTARVVLTAPLQVYTGDVKSGPAATLPPVPASVPAAAGQSSDVTPFAPDARSFSVNEPGACPSQRVDPFTKVFAPTASIGDALTTLTTDGLATVALTPAPFVETTRYAEQLPATTLSVPLARLIGANAPSGWQLVPSNDAVARSTCTLEIPDSASPPPMTSTLIVVRLVTPSTYETLPPLSVPVSVYS